MLVSMCVMDVACDDDALGVLCSLSWVVGSLYCLTCRTKRGARLFLLVSLLDILPGM